MANEFVNGVILGIKVQNFFCHDHLEINFEKSIKFIIGRNGSGKSAILTALIVGFGGKANVTNRGNSISSFVKEGSNSATIEIKIKNSGPKAYKHKEYGDQLTIIRIIPKNGSSRYKIRPASGKEMPVKYDDIQEILLAHDIQIDNPISVLNQDDAKNFIGVDEEKKYKFFRRATNIAQSESMYLEALDKLKTTKETWNVKKKTCEDLKRRYEDWKHKEKQWEKHEERRNQKEELEMELQWSKIEEAKREVNRLQKEYELKRKECDQQERELQYTPDESAIQNLNEELKRKRDEKEAFEQEKQTLEIELNNVNTEYQSLQVSKTKNLELIKKERQKVSEFEREIEDIISGSAERQRTQLEQLAAEAEATLQETRARLDTADDYERKANDAHCQATEAVNDARRLVRDRKAQLESLQRRERELRGGASSRAQYGERAMMLRRRVQEAAKRGEFSQPPRGPIGDYLEIEEEKWGSALEHILGGKIFSYCVNSSGDITKLLRIIDQVYSGSKEPKPGMVCTEFLPRRHDVRGRAVRDSALDALRVSDHVVANFLIDELSLETTMLVEEQEEAIRLASYAANVPANCRHIVTLDCSDYYPAPHFRCYGGRARAARILRVSTEYALTQVGEEVSTGRTALHSAQEELRVREGEVAGAREAWERAREQRRALAVSLQSAQRRHRDAQDELQRSKEPQYAEREEELSISKEKLQEMELKIKKFKEKEAENRRIFKGIEGQLNAKMLQLRNVTNTIKSLRATLEGERSQYEQSVRNQKSKIQNYKTNKAELDRLKERNESVLPEKLENIRTMTERAHACGEKINNPRSVQEVETLLRDTVMRLRSFTQLEHSAEEVHLQLHQTKQEYDVINNVLLQLENLIKELNEKTSKHLRFCQSRQTLIGRLVQDRFIQILNMRGIQGHLIVDHESKKLRFSTERSASGGESTFSMVAFLVALWDCVDLPFFFMDEFDVYLDGLNRDKVVELLLLAARERPTRQFVFLTPHAPPNLRAARDLDIHTMDRHQ